MTVMTGERDNTIENMPRDDESPHDALRQWLSVMLVILAMLLLCAQVIAMGCLSIGLDPVELLNSVLLQWRPLLFALVVLFCELLFWGTVTTWWNTRQQLRSTN